MRSGQPVKHSRQTWFKIWVSFLKNLEAYMCKYSLKFLAIFAKFISCNRATNTL